MKNISFALTTDQVRARTKTVTRRFGWWNVKPGDVLMACEKCQGLKPGEPLVRLGRIRVRSVMRERLNEIGDHLNDVAKEGFPGMSPADFVAMFCGHMKGVTPDTFINRIEFEYLDGENEDR